MLGHLEFSWTRQILDWVLYEAIRRRGQLAKRWSDDLINAASIVETMRLRPGSMKNDWGGLCSEMGDVTFDVFLLSMYSRCNTK